MKVEGEFNKLMFNSIQKFFKKKNLVCIIAHCFSPFGYIASLAKICNIIVILLSSCLTDKSKTFWEHFLLRFVSSWPFSRRNIVPNLFNMLVCSFAFTQGGCLKCCSCSFSPLSRHEQCIVCIITVHVRMLRKRTHVSGFCSCKKRRPAEWRIIKNTSRG